MDDETKQLIETVVDDERKQLFDAALAVMRLSAGADLTLSVVEDTIHVEQKRDRKWIATYNVEIQRKNDSTWTFIPVSTGIVHSQLKYALEAAYAILEGLQSAPQSLKP